MKIFYGWVIVGAGIVITCVGFGAMLTLSVFLQPMAEAMGWSRTGIAAAALLNFLGMGLGAFMWGALSDRFGTRVVVLCGGVLLGLGMVLASQATTLLQFQLLYGVVVGVATGSFYAPLISTTTRWFTEHRSLAVALVSAGLSVGSTVMAPLSRWLISQLRLAHRDVGHRRSRVAGGHSCRVPRAQPAPTSTAAGAPRLPGPAAATHGRAGGAHAAVRRHRAHPLRVLRGALRAHLPHGHNAIDRGVPAMAAATVLSVAGLASLSGKIGCGIFADRVGAKRTLVAGLALQAAAISLYLFTGGLGELLRARAPVRLRLRRGDAALRDPRARVLRRADHGQRVRGGPSRLDARMAVGRGSAPSCTTPRQLRVAVHRLGRDRSRGRGHRADIPPAARGGPAAAHPARGDVLTCPQALPAITQ